MSNPLKLASLMLAVIFSSHSTLAEDVHQRKVVLNLAPDGPADPTVLNQLLDAGASKRVTRTPLNLTGDAGTDTFAVPSTANIAGMNGAFYMTELKIFTRWQSSAVPVVMCFVPNGPPPTGGYSGSGYACRYYTLAGDTPYVWENVLGSLGISGAGYLLIGINPTTPNASSYTMSAWANTYTAGPTGGYYRTSLPIFGFTYNAATGLSMALNQDASTRNNIYVANLDMTFSATVYLYLNQNSPSWGTPVVVTLAPGEAEQYSLGALFPGYTGGAINIKFVTTGNSTSGVGYVIRTDNYTNNGIIEVPTSFNYSSWPN